LRKLEEIAIRKELEGLAEEQGQLDALLKAPKRQWKAIAGEIAGIRKEFGGKDALGRRRTELAAAPAPVMVPVEALVEREPVTVVCSRKGWIRAARGHNLDAAELKYKEGDEARFLVQAFTTDKILVFGTNGRFYALGADKLPGGRGHGEPLRLMIDLDNAHDIVALFVHRPGEKLLVASSDGRGFIVPADEALAQTRAGKQILVPGSGAVARLCVPVAGDHVALVGTNGKLLIFKLDEVPEMARGRGVILQRYKDGKLADALTFALADGLTYRLGDTRTRTETDLASWLGTRAQTGRLAPTPLARGKRFT
jgi:topoisomerase-4 subunit A